MTPLEAAFQRFKNKYFTAIRIDTELGQCDYDDGKFNRLERKSTRAPKSRNGWHEFADLRRIWNSKGNQK